MGKGRWVVASETKTCRKCKKAKPLSQFGGERFEKNCCASCRIQIANQKSSKKRWADSMMDNLQLDANDY